MTMETTSDVELVRAFVKGRSEEAFRAIVERHSGWLFASAYRQLRDVQLAEDAVQTVFVLLSQKAPAMNQDHKLSGWLFNTMGYTVRAMRRNRRRAEKREANVATGGDNGGGRGRCPAGGAGCSGGSPSGGGSGRDSFALLPESPVQPGGAGVEHHRRDGRANGWSGQSRGFGGALGRDGQNLTDASLGLVAAHGLQHAPAGMAVNVVQSALHATALPASAAAAVKGATLLMAMSKLKTATVLAALGALIFGGGATFVVMHHSGAAAKAGVMVPIATAGRGRGHPVQAGLERCAGV